MRTESRPFLIASCLHRAWCRLVRSALLMACMAMALPAAALDSFTMAFGHDPAQQPQYRFYELIYTEAFKRLGFTFAYKVYPSKRCSALANAGAVDGEPQRIADYAKTYPNMVRVDEAIFTNRVIAFSTNTSIHLDGWDSFRGTNYRVDYRIGSRVAEEELPKRVNPKLLSGVPAVEQILKKLKTRHTDVFVDAEWLVLPLLNSPEFKDSGIAQVGIIASDFSYPFLHKKHAELAPRLAEVLRQLKKEGVYDRLLEQATALPLK